MTSTIQAVPTLASVSRNAVHTFVVLVCICCASGLALAQDSATPGAPNSDEAVLVSVDDEQITEADLKLAMLIRRIGPEAPASVRKQLLEQLIDEQLIRGHLSQRQVKTDPSRIDDRLQRVYRWIRQSGRDPQAVLTSIGSSEADLREELALPAAWRIYFDRVVTAERVREYFTEHKPEFDETQVRASQILIKLPDDDEAAANAAADMLRDLGAKIVAGDMTFAEAATEYSQGATADRGGDLGFFPFRGQMPRAFTEQVFPLEVGELSEPFRTRYGMHLATVTERREGRLSLEDARPQVMRQLSQELWDETLVPLRKQASIEWHTDGDSE